MAVDLTINGVLNVKAKTYKVTEDATPVDASNMSAGSGQAVITVTEDSNTKTLTGSAVILSDGSQGTTSGITTGITSADGVVTLTVDSRMSLLNGTRTAQPFVGTLQNAFIYYCGLVGITSGIVVDTAIASNAVVFPGWSGVVWDFLKQMAVAQRVELSLVSNNVVLRPYRTRLAQNYRDATHNWAIDTSKMAQSVQIYYYQNSSQTNGPAYPDGGWSTATQPENAIAAGTTQVYTYPISSSLSSVSQPVAVDSVSMYYNASSVYTVLGGNNTAIPAAQWVAEGGSITVAIGADTKTLIVTVTASPNTANGPYNIAMLNTSGANFSSLRIVGTGVFVGKKLLTLKTSADPTKVSAVIGVTVDNPFISSVTQALDCGIWVAKAYGAPTQTITVTTSGVNRLGDTGSYAYPTFAQFDAATTVGQTFGQFDSANPSLTFAQFDATWLATVSGTFANQAFGNVAGVRVLYDNAYYRVLSATLEPAALTYTATEDTTFGDFDNVWPAGTTFGAFDAGFWSGKAFSDFNIHPLQKS